MSTPVSCGPAARPAADPGRVLCVASTGVTTRRVLLQAATSRVAASLALLGAGCARPGLPGGAGGSAPRPTIEPVTIEWSSGEGFPFEGPLDLWQTWRSPIHVTRTRVTGQYVAAIVTQAAAGTPPDLARANWDWFADWWAKDLLLPVDSFVKRDRFDLTIFVDGVIPALRLRGELPVLPWTSSSSILFFNRDLFHKAQVPEPPANGQWTLDDLRERAIKLTPPVPDGERQQWGYEAPLQFIWEIGDLIHMYRGKIMDDARNQLLLDSPQVLAAVDWHMDNARRHRLNPSPEDVARLQLGNRPFGSGRVAMSWAPLERISLRPWVDATFDWDLAEVPLHPQTRRKSSMVTPNSWAIMRGGKHHDATWEFLRFLVTDGAEPMARGDVPVPVKKVMETVWAQGVGSARKINRRAAVNMYRHPQPTYYRPGFSQIHGAVNRALTMAERGEISTRDALVQAAQEGHRLIAENSWPR